MCYLGFESQLLFHPMGDIVGESFVSQGQGPKEDSVAPFNAETEVWRSWDIPPCVVCNSDCWVGSSVACVGWQR